MNPEFDKSILFPFPLKNSICTLPSPGPKAQAPKAQAPKAQAPKAQAC